MASVESPGETIELKDSPTTQPQPSSNTNPQAVNNQLITIITSDRYGYCLYYCEIHPNDNCGIAMVKARQAMFEGQNSMWNKLLRLLAPLLFTFVICLGQYEEVYQSPWVS
jgi:hypothetical protein